MIEQILQASARGIELADQRRIIEQYRQVTAEHHEIQKVVRRETLGARNSHGDTGDEQHIQLSIEREDEPQEAL